MRRVTKGYSGEETPLFATMLVIDQTGQGEGSTIPAGSQHTPLIAPSTEPHLDTSAQSPLTKPHTPSPQLTKPPTSSIIKETIIQEFEIPQSNFPTQTPIADEAAFTGMDVVHGGAATTGRSMIEEMDLDAGISLVPPHVEVQGRYGQNLDTQEGFGAGLEVTTVDAELNTVSTFVSTASPQRHADTTADDLTLAETLMEIKKSAAKAKGKAKMDETESPKKMKQREQRMAQVHQAAQGFTDAEWDDVLARVAADEDFDQQLQAGEKCSEEDLPMKLVELVNQRKKFFAQQRAEAKRNKLMTPAQQKEYIAGQEVLEEPVKRQKIGEALGLGEESAEKEKELSEEEL
ncbi:hypothetical protein Tco_0931606 [Tanacetum coccineum]